MLSWCQMLLQDVLQINKKLMAMDDSNKISGATALLQCLIKEKIDALFGYPGGAIMPIYDALYDYTKDIQHILARHEQGAIHAAQGYARATGKVGVVFATSGPGATNLVTGLADAMMDSTPLVCFTGQVYSHLLGVDAFQEIDIIGISMPITKWNYQITSPEEIPNIVAKAFYLAQSGRPGPVLIDISKDAQINKIPSFTYAPCQTIRSYHPTPKIDIKSVSAAATLIKNAKKPLLIVGQGIILSKAEEALLEFANLTGIPVACTLLGLGAFPQNHDQYVGMVGMHGDYAPNIKTNECDVLIGIGLRFDDRVTSDVSQYAQQAKIIHIDIDIAEIKKIIPTDIFIHADAKEALNALCKEATNHISTTWLEEFKEAKKIEIEALKKNAQKDTTGKIRMEDTIKLLSDISHSQSIIVTDVGQHQMMAARYYKYLYSKTFITSGGLGTMGFGLPAAIGAKIGIPNKEVILVVGDGSFQMTLEELGVILQEKIAVKILLLNNGYLGMVRQWQQLFLEKRYSFTPIISPDFVMLVQSYGIQASQISDPKDLKNGLTNMLQSQESYLLEVKVAPEENVFPMVSPGASISDTKLN
ncbi:MAG: biosynthetic-type acetolactate synthase large subunit [Chitinophagaceae bacterium]